MSDWFLWMLLASNAFTCIVMLLWQHTALRWEKAYRDVREAAEIYKWAVFRLAAKHDPDTYTRLAGLAARQGMKVPPRDLEDVP